MDYRARDGFTYGQPDPRLNGARVSFGQDGKTRILLPDEERGFEVPVNDRPRAFDGLQDPKGSHMGMERLLRGSQHNVNMSIALGQNRNFMNNLVLNNPSLQAADAARPKMTKEQMNYLSHQSRNQRRRLEQAEAPVFDNTPASVSTPALANNPAENYRSDILLWTAASSQEIAEHLNNLHYGGNPVITADQVGNIRNSNQRS